MDSLNCNCNIINKFLPFEFYKVDKEIDIKDFALKHRVSLQNCIYENSVLKSGDFVIIKSFLQKMHVVRPGETLEQIAQQYNKSLEHLKKINKIDKIFVGQQLLI